MFDHRKAVVISFLRNRCGVLRGGSWQASVTPAGSCPAWRSLVVNDPCLMLDASGVSGVERSGVLGVLMASVFGGAVPLATRSAAESCTSYSL